MSDRLECHACRKTVLLVSGDLAALLLFAAIGRANHGESLDAVSVLKTAAPFLIGRPLVLQWFKEDRI